jgi:predicted RND superfamily exporter protein
MTVERPRASRKQRLLLRVEAFSRRRYAWVLLASLAILVGASWLGSRIRLESDVLKLIPEGNRQVDTFRDALRDFGSIDYLLVLLDAKDETEPGTLEEFADVYAEKLAARPDLVETVEYRFQPDAKFLQLFTRNALLFLTPDELPQIAAKLTDPEIRAQIRDNKMALASPAAPLAEELVLRDPLGLMPLFVDRLLSHRGALKLDLSSGYYLSEDGRSLIMLVKPARPSQNLEFSRELMAAARADAQASGEELFGAGAGKAAVDVRFTGNPAILEDEAGLLRETVQINIVASFFAVTLLYWLCYRRFAALLYSAYPLMIGQAATFAVALFALGTLNSASSALPALLMGLGTDFTIVMYARYVEERRNGASLARATELMVGEGGLGVFTGAITSAGTFFALCVSGFRGLRDLGFLIGAGILLCGIAIVFLLPAMIVWNEEVRRRKTDAVKKLHLQSFGLEHLLGVSARHPRAVLAVVAVLVAGSGWLAVHLDFDDTINALRSNKSESFRVQNEVSERFGASLSYMMAIVEAPSVEEAVDLAQEVRGRLQPFVDDGTVGRFESILDFLPPRERQDEVIAALRAGADGPFDPARIRGTIESALDANGFRAEPFSDWLGMLDNFLAPKRPIALADLEGQGLGRMVERFVHREGDTVRIVTYLYPTDPRWKREAPPGLVEALSRGDGRITVTGTNVVSRELRHLFVGDALRSVVLGLLIVAVLLWVDFRSLWLTGVALAQLLAGVVMMLGAMRLFGIAVNYANSFVATMIMGVGIDYSIHLIHRLHLNGGVLDEGVKETGKGVVLAALTNVAGFGTLTLGNYPAMRSVGVVALMGSITCLFTALTIVPAWMARRSGAPST